MYCDHAPEETRDVGAMCAPGPARAHPGRAPNERAAARSRAAMPGGRARESATWLCVTLAGSRAAAADAARRNAALRDARVPVASSLAFGVATPTRAIVDSEARCAKLSAPCRGAAAGPRLDYGSCRKARAHGARVSARCAGPVAAQECANGRVSYAAAALAYAALHTYGVMQEAPLRLSLDQQRRALAGAAWVGEHLCLPASDLPCALREARKAKDQEAAMALQWAMVAYWYGLTPEHTAPALAKVKARLSAEESAERAWQRYVDRRKPVTRNANAARKGQRLGH